MEWLRKDTETFNEKQSVPGTRYVPGTSRAQVTRITARNSLLIAVLGASIDNVRPSDVVVTASHLNGNKQWTWATRAGREITTLTHTGALQCLRNQTGKKMQVCRTAS